MPVSEIPLREGLKWMMTLTAALLTVSVQLPGEDYKRVEDEAIDAFLAGLRTNGYEIRPVDETA